MIFYLTNKTAMALAQKSFNDNIPAAYSDENLMGFQKDVKRGWSRAKSSWESSGFDIDEFIGIWKRGTPLATL